ncbi:MAG: hypothetical protein ACYTGC_08085 [Planctomycetota bacterium]
MIGITSRDCQAFLTDAMWAGVDQVLIDPLQFVQLYESLLRFRREGRSFTS